MTEKTPLATDHVRAFAAKHGVDLSTVPGSGADGRVDIIDVIKIVKARNEEAQAAAWRAEAAAADRERQRMQGATGTSRRPGFALNPLVDRARDGRRAAGRPLPSAPAPTLFAAGDLPSFTASGAPPEALLGVPWQARHAMAAATTLAEAYAVQDECSGDEAERIAEAMYGGHDGTADYVHRVQQWCFDAMSDAELRDSVAPGSVEARDRRELQRVEAFNASLRAGQPDYGQDAEGTGAAIDQIVNGTFQVNNGIDHTGG